MLTLPECCSISAFGNAATGQSSCMPCTLTSLPTSTPVSSECFCQSQSTSAHESTQSTSDTQGRDPGAGPAALLCWCLPKHQRMRNTWNWTRIPTHTHHPRCCCFPKLVTTQRKLQVEFNSSVGRNNSWEGGSTLDTVLAFE